MNLNNEFLRDIVKKHLVDFDYKLLGLEIIGIVFAVLFALAVDEWQETREQEALTAKLMSNINKEVKENKADLIYHMKQNTEVVNGLDLLTNKRITDNLNYDELRTIWSIHLPGLSSTAWDSILLTNSMIHIELEALEKLSDIYQTQKDFNEYGNYLIRNFGLLSAQLEKDPRLSLNTHKVNLTTLVSLGASLERSYKTYEDFQKKINDK